ncbi:hypothetical protein ACIBJF_47280 [Streptomyces sp. NPDC050743]|uniref:hypothetical protein n=1 Tax=Streptomyces sp. NPDC050743 TaxID=3365634 RepID=UPI0037AD6235
MNRAILASALALASAATCVVLAPSASAAAQSCVTTTLTTGEREGVGSTAYKSSTSSCRDLNLVYAHDKEGWGDDNYAGRLWHSSGGYWQTCSAGYIGIFDGSYPVDKYLPCTDVAGGTKFTIASYWAGGDTVKITH